MNGFGENIRKKLQNTRWIWVLLLVVGALVASGILPRRPHSSEKMKHFNGVIAHDRVTFDQWKSDLFVRASRALDQGDVKTAENLYREAIVKYPDDPDGYTALGATFYFQGSYAEAKVEYLNALEKNSGDVDAIYGLGCVAYHDAEMEQARQHLEKALSLDPTNGLCHRLLGLIHDAENDEEKALVHYERAAALDSAAAEDEHIKRRIEEISKRLRRD